MKAFRLDARLMLSRGLLARHEFGQAKTVLTALAADAPNLPEVHAQIGVLLGFIDQTGANPLWLLTGEGMKYRRNADETILSELTPDEQTALFSGNAERVFRL